MVNRLLKIFEKSIIFKYKLPYKLINGLITKSNLTSENFNDYCYQASNDKELSNLIYNGILDYALEEENIKIEMLNDKQKLAISSYIRYSEYDDLKTKLSYGFYGEVILDLILKYSFHSKTLIARGEFYDPTSGSEPTGYDAFHFFYDESQNKIILMFGEAKFHQKNITAINSLLINIKKALSTRYFNDNLATVFKKEKEPKINTLPEDFKDILNIFLKGKMNKKDIYDNIKLKKLELWYPILLIFDEENESYNDVIKKQ